MLRPESHAHEACRNSAEQRISIEETHDAWGFDGTLRLQRRHEYGFLHYHLHALGDARGKFASSLNGL